MQQYCFLIYETENMKNIKRVKKLHRLLGTVVYDVMDSPVGSLIIVASTQGIHNILWESESNTDMCKGILKNCEQNSQHEMIVKARQQLMEYFNSKRKVFNLSLCLDGTPFQIQAWQELCKIPYGETISYGEQAERLGDKNKARAIGLANGLNPIPIIVPCHRVIGSNGSLTGFGGGLENKSILLELERKNYG